MTRDEIRAVVTGVLGELAPEAELGSLDARSDICEELDLDSMDFLNFAVRLHQRLGVDIPESDQPRLRTLELCLDYLQSRLGASSEAAQPQ